MAPCADFTPKSNLAESVKYFELAEIMKSILEFSYTVKPPKTTSNLSSDTKLVMDPCQAAAQ